MKNIAVIPYYFLILLMFASSGAFSESKIRGTLHSDSEKTISVLTKASKRDTKKIKEDEPRSVNDKVQKYKKSSNGLEGASKVSDGSKVAKKDVGEIKKGNIDKRVPNKIIVSKKSVSWGQYCPENGRGYCQIFHNIVDSKTDKKLLTVIVRKTQNKEKPTMLLQLPTKIFLPYGVKIKVDDGKDLFVDITTCDSSFCYSNFDISEELLRTMRIGKDLKTTFSTLTKKAIELPVPLKGFAPAYHKISVKNSQN